MRIAAIIGVGAAAAAIAACSLLTSLDGLTDGPAAAEGGGAGTETSTADGGDGSVDAGDAGDSGDGGDSGISREGCPTGKGPLPVRIDTDAGFYCIDSTEVTREQYDAFLSSNPATTHPRCAFNNTFVPTRDWPYGAATAKHPVLGVDWCDAYEFCAWAGKHLCGAIGGGEITPASVQEPEKSAMVHACSRGGTRTYAYGNTFSPTICNTVGRGVGSTIAVGTAPGCEGGYAGIFDLVGNASEWEDACNLVDGGAANGSDDTCRSFNSGYDEAQEADLRCTTIRTLARSYAAPRLGFRCCSP